MKELIQPVLVSNPEPGHDVKDVLTLQEFINLLKEEEDYWPGEQHNTKLMISRLRKIFYDQWGWNKELIKGAANIECRYEVTIVDTPTEHSRAVTRYAKNEYVPKHRMVTYRDNDRVYGNTRVGISPFIYKSDHQEIRLPDGTMCDAAHILAGLDAYNYKDIVTPLPSFLKFAAKLFPHVDSNVDIVTWLGDIASSAGDFLFEYLRTNKQPLSIDTEQHYIDIDAPGSDMLGDIDPYVIAKYYNVGSTDGQRYTDILFNYYIGTQMNPPIRNFRMSIFCESVGLKGWDGKNFANENEWLEYYRKQLRDNTCFQVFSLVEENLKSFFMLMRIWFGGYKSVLKLELLLEIYLKALKDGIKKEGAMPHKNLLTQQADFIKTTILEKTET